MEIFSVGNELLNGSVHDSNSFWLTTRIMELGGKVRRVTILPDELETIAHEIRQARDRSLDVLLLTGGLGPTRDDLTLAAVAAGFDLPLVLHQQAREMIRAGYDALAAQGVIAQGGLNAPREKMARFPQGGRPLPNPAGTAPGMLLRQGAMIVVCFPGVPAEMKAIFDASLEAILTREYPGQAFARHTLRIASNDESELAPYLQRFETSYPAIHVKARSGIIADNPCLEFTFSMHAGDEQEARGLLRAAVHELAAWLAADGIAVSR